MPRPHNDEPAQARRHVDLVVPVSWEYEWCPLPVGLPVELRGFKWGSEPETQPKETGPRRLGRRRLGRRRLGRQETGPTETGPGWPASTTGNGAPTGGANAKPSSGAATETTADRQGSQWWPEPGNGAGATGYNGHSNADGASAPRWGVNSDGPDRAEDSWRGSPPAGNAWAGPGYSYGQPRPDDQPSDGGLSPWAPGGRLPATNGQAHPGQGHRGQGQSGLARRPQPGTGPAKPQSALRRAWQRFITALAAVGAFLAKFGALLLKVKYVGLVLSMLVSIVAYSLFFGWSFAVGIVLLILVHEMGHVVELRRQGVPASAPLFIPFLGAFVNMRGSPRSAYQEALSGLAGPLVGTAASVVIAFWANATGSKFLMALAFFGFFVNLFNLLPVLPLDGGRAAAALHPALWLLGLVALLAFEFIYPSPVIPIVLILGGIELWRRWRYRNSPASRAYNALLPQQRFAIGAFYVALVAVTIVGAHATYIARSI